MSDGPEKWVPEAVAEQEEYIKRTKSCLDQLGLAHSWDGGEIERCSRCNVTRTPGDYRRTVPVPKTSVCEHSGTRIHREQRDGTCAYCGHPLVAGGEQ